MWTTLRVAAQAHGLYDESHPDSLTHLTGLIPPNTSDADPEVREAADRAMAYGARELVRRIDQPFAASMVQPTPPIVLRRRELERALGPGADNVRLLVHVANGVACTDYVPEITEVWWSAAESAVLLRRAAIEGLQRPARVGDAEAVEALAALARWAEPSTIRHEALYALAGAATSARVRRECSTLGADGEHGFPAAACRLLRFVREHEV